MYINRKQIKDFYHSKGKRISKKAILTLNIKVENILLGSLKNAGKFKTIRDIEIALAKG